MSKGIDFLKNDSDKELLSAMLEGLGKCQECIRKWHNSIHQKDFLIAGDDIDDYFSIFINNLENHIDGAIYTLIQDDY
jgi:hypothetical protein